MRLDWAERTGEVGKVRQDRRWTSGEVGQVRRDRS